LKREQTKFVINEERYEETLNMEEDEATNALLKNV
jgi:hypothetical protein